MTDQALDTGERPPPADPPSPPVSAAPPDTLPPAAPCFVGRTRELAQLRADIDRPGLAPPGSAAPDRGRVLLVAGRPGSGRTALALRLARDVADRYDGGLLFARLTAGGERVPTEQTARSLLRALGTPPPPPEAGPGAAGAAVRAALEGRRAILVLDDVAHADQLLALLPADCGGLVVATSDGPLPGVADVRPCTVGGLDAEASIALLSRSLGSTRVTNDPRGAETLVQECAGHPTALRLVAAWLAAQPRMSVTDATRRLRAVPDTPTGPGPGTSAPALGRPPADAGSVAPEPESGTWPSTPAPLVRAFRLIYHDLPPAVGRTLRLLALAPAGFVDAHIASALVGCSVAAVQSILDELAARGLLHVEPAAAAAGPGEAAPAQYQLPGCLEPLLRALLERDRPAEVRLARARMLERTVRLLQSCRITLEPDGSPARAALGGMPRSLRFSSREAAAEWLRVRLPALLAAARTAVADGELDTLARRLVAATVRVLGSYPGGGETAGDRYQLHGLVLDVAERRGLQREKAAALINLGDLDAEAGRTAQALERYRSALTAAREGDDGEAEGRALESIAGAYGELCDLQRACDWYGRALAMRQARGETAHQARLHGRLGALHTYEGQYGPALREWRAAFGAYRRLGDLPAQARALSEAARVQEYAGHPEDSLRTCRDALHWARQAEDQRLEGAVLLRMADTLDRLGDPGGARLQRTAAKRLLSPGEIPGS